MMHELGTNCEVKTRHPKRRTDSCTTPPAQSDASNDLIQMAETERRIMLATKLQPAGQLKVLFDFYLTKRCHMSLVTKMPRTSRVNKLFHG